MNNTTPTSDVTPKKKRGCFFYGCLTATIVVIGCAVAFVFIGQRVAEQVTKSQSIEIEPITFTAAEGEEVINKIYAFKMRLKTGNGPEEIELTEREINVVIAAHKEWSVASPFLRVNIEQGKIGIKYKVPFDPRIFGIDDSSPFVKSMLASLKGVSIAGSAAVKLQITEEDIDIRIDEINSPGIPSMLVNKLRDENLADRMTARTRKELHQIKSLEIGDENVIAVAR